MYMHACLACSTRTCAEPQSVAEVICDLLKFSTGTCAEPQSVAEALQPTEVQHPNLEASMISVCYNATTEILVSPIGKDFCYSSGNILLIN